MKLSSVFKSFLACSVLFIGHSIGYASPETHDKALKRFERLQNQSDRKQEVKAIFEEHRTEREATREQFKSMIQEQRSARQEKREEMRSLIEQQRDERQQMREEMKSRRGQ